MSYSRPVYYSTSDSGAYLSHANASLVRGRDWSWCFLEDPHLHGLAGGFMFLTGEADCPDRFGGRFQFAHQGTGTVRTEERGAVEIKCTEEG